MSNNSRKPKTDNKADAGSSQAPAESKAAGAAPNAGAQPGAPAEGSARLRRVPFSRWLFSRTVRQAVAMRKHVQKILAHQRDILTPKAIAEVESAVRQVNETIAGTRDKAALRQQMQDLENAANTWLKPYPHPAWRENVEVLLVALTVALGIRTFFLQPFKIPTGSMQPTLYGVTSENLLEEPGAKIPTGWERIKEWFEGVSYIHVVAEHSGAFEGVSKPVRFLIFNLRQSIDIGGHLQSIWFPPDYGEAPLPLRAGLNTGDVFSKGQDVIKLRVTAGDHLFVDRLTYNFRPPERGEIVVFETKGIPKEMRQAMHPPIPADQFYIKRLIGLGGETLSIHQDYLVTGVPRFGDVPAGNVVVNGRPLTAATPHFENLYTFYGASDDVKVLPYRENRYFGHGMIGLLSAGNSFHVRRHYLFVMGDNTMNSLDSRYWGDFPERYVIGRAFFVYWPITSRFGWNCLSH